MHLVLSIDLTHTILLLVSASVLLFLALPLLIMLSVYEITLKTRVYRMASVMSVNVMLFGG